MDLGLDGRNALVTGGSAGLGFGCAQALVDAGARVVVAARSEEGLRAAAARLGPNADWLTIDMTEVESVGDRVAEAVDRVGPFDIVIANSGGPPPGTAATTPVDAFPAALRSNLLSTIALCQATVPTMRTRRWGRVVAITSIAVREPIDQLVLSNTARTGLTAYLKSLAREVAADGVTVNSLQPGLHATGRLGRLYGADASGAMPPDLAASVPAGVLGDPADFGRAAAFLCSESARFITGVALPIDGGAGHGLQ